jgi:hypothetical protein
MTQLNLKAYVKIGGNNVDKQTIAFLVVLAVYGLILSGNTLTMIVLITTTKFTNDINTHGKHLGNLGGDL